MTISRKTVDALVIKETESTEVVEGVSLLNNNNALAFTDIYGKHLVGGKFVKGVLGEDAPAGAAVYVSDAEPGDPQERTVGRLFKVNGSQQSHIDGYLGVLVSGGSTGETKLVQRSGVLQLAGFIVGQPIWLGEDGALTQTPPQPGKGLAIGKTLTSSSVYLIPRNHRSPINFIRPPIDLLQGTVNTVMDLSYMDGGVLEGKVFVNATTNLRGMYRIEFQKNGAGIYVSSTSRTGDRAALRCGVADSGKLEIELGSYEGFQSAGFVWVLVVSV